MTKRDVSKLFTAPSIPDLFTDMAKSLAEQIRGAETALPVSKIYWDDPVAFVHDCFRWPLGQHASAYQDEILAEFPSRKRASVRSPHGTGKSTMLAWIILWFALTRSGVTDFKIPTTASVFRQLQRFLWPEIHKWAQFLNWERLGRPPFDERTELSSMALRLKGGEAFAMSSRRADLIEGAHASELLFVFDEAKTITDPTWDSAEGAFSAGTCYWLAFSTPGDPVGRFYDIQSRKPGYEDWWVRHVTIDEAVAAGRVSADWVRDRELQWGRESQVFQNRVLGEFATASEDALIPLSYIEAANDRWAEQQDEAMNEPVTAVGVDVARFGDDKTVIARRHGNFVEQLQYYRKQDTMETTGYCMAALRDCGLGVIDVVGVGAGVYDRLNELSKSKDAKFKLLAFNASAKAGNHLKDRTGQFGFVNLRSAAWWHMRELLDPFSESEIALPPDDMLTGDLTTPKWKLDSSGRVLLESKESFKERLGRSTNSGDAAIMAFWLPTHVPFDDEDMQAYASGIINLDEVSSELAEYAKSVGVQSEPQVFDRRRFRA